MHFEIVQRICSRECIWIFLCCKEWHIYMQHFFEAFSVGSHLKPAWNLPLVVLKHTIGPVYYTCRCSLHTMFILYLWITLDWPHWGYKFKGIFFQGSLSNICHLCKLWYYIVHVPRLLRTINRYASNSTASSVLKEVEGVKHQKSHLVGLTDEERPQSTSIILLSYTVVSILFHQVYYRDNDLRMG